MRKPRNHFPTRMRQAGHMSLMHQPSRKTTTQKAARPKLSVTRKWPRDRPPEAAALRTAPPEESALWSGLQLKR